MDNIQTVQQIYAAFGRGDVPAILDRLSADVDWEYASSVDVPWLRRRRGPQEVAGFFTALAEGFAISRFQVKETLASADGQVVAVLVDVAATVTRTGRNVEETDEIHLWRFDPDGKVRKFRHGADTAAHAAAWAQR